MRETEKSHGVLSTAYFILLKWILQIPGCELGQIARLRRRGEGFVVYVFYFSLRFSSTIQCQGRAPLLLYVRKVFSAPQPGQEEWQVAGKRLCGCGRICV